MSGKKIEFMANENCQNLLSNCI